MKKIVLSCLLVLAVTACQKKPDSIDFVSGMQDVPLMEGLKVQRDKSSIFDTLSGKIVSATATGNIPERRVRRFYKDTMPHLGWAEADTLIFLKDDEQVKITTEAQNKSTTIVHYYLSPSE
jgi:hypothetical protein